MISVGLSLMLARSGIPTVAPAGDPAYVAASQRQDETGAGTGFDNSVAGVQAGDLILYFGFIHNSSTPPGLPAGHTNIATSVMANSACRLSYRVADASDVGASWVPTGVGGRAFMAVIRDFDPADPIGAFSGFAQSADNTPEWNGLTVTGPDGLVIGVRGTRGSFPLQLYPGAVAMEDFGGQNGSIQVIGTGSGPYTTTPTGSLAPYTEPDGGTSAVQAHTALIYINPAPAAPPSLYADSSAVAGGDGTAGAPFNTLAALTAAMGASANAILTGTFRETLTPSAAGQTFTGTATVSGADVVTGLTEGAADVWSGALATEPSQVFVDGERGLRVATAGEVNAYRRWHWASNTLTVYAAAGVTPAVEASVRAAAIDCAEFDGITIDGIRAERALVGIDGDGCNGLTIRNATVADAFVEGITHNALGGETLTDLLIEDSEITGCGGTGIQFNMRHTGVILRRLAIHHCCHLHQAQVGGHARQEWSGGIKWWGNALNDIFASVLVEDCDLYDLGPQFDAGSGAGNRGVGIWGDHYYYGTPPASPEVVVTGCVVVRCQSWGIYGEKTEATLFEDCAVLDPSYGASGTGTTLYTAGACLAANDAPPGDCLASEIAHCTIIGGWWGLAFNSAAVANALTGCIIRDCIATGAYQPSGPWDGENFYASTTVNDGTHGSGNVVQNCNLGPDRSAMARWTGTAYATAAAFDTAQAAVSGMVSGDPLFVNVAADDYRLGVGSPCLAAGTDGADLGAPAAVLTRLAALA